ncbi:hypothetical protein [Lysinibacillus sp. NPDC056232]
MKGFFYLHFVTLTKSGRNVFCAKAKRQQQLGQGEIDIFLIFRKEIVCML